MKDSSTGSVFTPRIESENFFEQAMRERARGWIEGMIEEELEAALGVGCYQRAAQRRGYRKGVRPRSFTTSLGKQTIALPRASLFVAGEEKSKEWRSRLLPRYARRTSAVEEALMTSYLCGNSTRKIRKALSPLLHEAALSKSTVSRILARLEESFEAWKSRDLTGEEIALLFLDGFYLKIRLGGKVHSIPVLVASGVRSDGSRVLLCLHVRTSESGAAWKWLTEDLVRRGVKMPVLAVIDGSGGLHDAVKHSWPWIEVQRCTKHKLENLATHAPKSRFEEIKEDYHAIVYAGSESKARAAWERFEARWKAACPEVVKSLREGGEQLLTFYLYPESMWKSLRTTNGIERMNGEFRRRVKTQGSFPNAQAPLRLLFGLFAAGLITMNRVHGWRDLRAALVAKRIALGLIKAEKRIA